MGSVSAGPSRVAGRVTSSGLLAPPLRKNRWIIAEHAGDAGLDGMQGLLPRVTWDDAEVRADVREFVGDQLGDVDAVLIIDEMGDVKKRRHTVSVQRQHSERAGEDRELPGRRAPSLCCRGCSRDAQPGPLPAEILA
ncbi:transposase [Plantactinospora sp. WMMC1484]|uniref:transposase n=1 Tax=Plantactinospora sp. WMMC1484 TaxID=3404122 RepID=UPI003BF4B429